MAGFAFVGKAVLFSFINLIYTLRAQRRLCARGRSVRRGGPFWRAGRAVLQRKTARFCNWLSVSRLRPASFGLACARLLLLLACSLQLVDAA